MHERSDLHFYWQMRNPISGWCLDTLGHNSRGATLGAIRCHGMGGNQVRRKLAEAKAKCYDRPRSATLYYIVGRV